MSKINRAYCIKAQANSIVNESHRKPPTCDFFPNKDRLYGQKGIKVTYMDSSSIDQLITNKATN
jgi:hypothetical protein